jgi:hypothetical protein
MWRRLFLDHPRSMDEGYFEHQRAAFGYGLELLRAAGACLLHGLVPGLCQTTASRSIADLNARISQRRGRVVRMGGGVHPA